MGKRYYGSQKNRAKAMARIDDPTNSRKKAAQAAFVNQRAKNSSKNRGVGVSLHKLSLPEVE